ncbi:LOW QUALITY PROTEIN: hypothetical protein BC938DRAFT_473312 [Jimgerdemannia flammicorona]|uniref:Uncharacterized protein n=1 Tax=Jimgerdemannia flammicorona TaxID=994334 RepID=A0A433Q474_9FUNG|nr:LOW QUALITY PROTEIN: hypothetical protein BC938DRAFT_473312 [Jimgerdemannia flammicorona]
MCFEVPKLSEENASFFDSLLTAKDVDTVPAATAEQKNLTKLVSRFLDSVMMLEKNSMSETEHQCRNIMPLLDATIRIDNQYLVNSPWKQLQHVETKGETRMKEIGSHVANRNIKLNINNITIEEFQYTKPAVALQAH